MAFKNSERLAGYTHHGLGLEREAVRLSHHNPSWKRLFSDEAYFVFDHLRDESLRLYHCGSTAIANMPAKPIIDLVGSVASLAEVDARMDRLTEIGYEYKGESGIKGRRYAVLHSADKAIVYFHLHLFQHDDPEVERHLLFRDYLRHSLEPAAEYEALKKRLAAELKVDRARYSDAKAELMRKLQSEAVAMGRKTAKVVAILGSASAHGNTRSLVEEKYGTGLEIIDLPESKVASYAHYPRRPPEGDEFQAIVRKMAAADLIVWATPVYWYAMSGPLKNFVDRLSDLLSGQEKELAGALYGKRLALVATGADERLPLGFETPFAATAIYFGMDYLGATYRSVRG